jgi:hypothetical protein
MTENTLQIVCAHQEFPTVTRTRARDPERSWRKKDPIIPILGQIDAALISQIPYNINRLAGDYGYEDQR